MRRYIQPTRLPCLLVSLLLAITIMPSAQAQFSNLSFQGLLTNSGGDPVADGNYNIQFRIYPQQTGGPILWSEVQNLPVADGIVSATLGSVTPINLPFDEQYYLTIIVPPDTLYPRTLLAAAPYSMTAKTLTAPATITGSGGGTALTVSGSATAAYLDGNVFVADSLHVFAATRINQYLVVHQKATILGGLSAGDLQAPSGGKVGVGTSSPATRFHVVDNINGAGSVGNHVMLIDNTATGTNGDGLAIRLGAADPGASNNFVSFFDGASAAYGRIDGNGSNGVVYGTTGGDYAEYLPRLDPGETIDAGDVVAVVGGKITRDTEHADRVMALTDRPAVLGNMPDPAHEDLYERVAFIGQVPVKIRGPVRSGDFLIPSGLHDGTAVAIDPAEIQVEQLRFVFATAWESNNDTGLRKVIAAIGIDQSAAAVRVIESLHERDRRRENELRDIMERLAQLEERLAL